MVYGAVAQPPATTGGILEKGKHLLRRIHDRMMHKHLKQHKVDYRNYASESAFNKGDLAITQASIQSIKKHSPNIELIRKNWGDLDKNPSHRTRLAICGSGYFSPSDEKRFPSRLHQDLAWIKDQGSLSMIYGVGVNLVDPTLKIGALRLSSEQSDFLADFLERCEHISVRDVTSQQLLQSCTSRTVHLVGDPALFIEASTPISPEQHLPKDRVHIGINLPFHGPSACARINDDIGAYVIALKNIQRKTGCLFHYMVHYESELLVAALLQDRGIKLKVVNGDVDDLLHTYKQLNLHIGGMLHSCILASSTGTPAIGLAYDIKHSGFFSLLGLPEHCIPAQPFDADRLATLALHSLSNEQILRSTILSRRLALRHRADDFLRSALMQFNQEA